MHNMMNGTVSKLQWLSRYSKGFLQSRQKAQHTPQSSTIQGILQDLYDTFTQDLEGMHTEEASESTSFEGMIATKQEQALQLKEKVQKAEQVKVEAEVMLSEAVQTYGDTEEQLKSDTDYFDSTKSACIAKADDWATRKKLRTEELAGISEALTILTSDEAKELFGKSIKPGVGMFLQLASEKDAAAMFPAQQAVRVMRQQAAKVHSLRLTAMVAQVQLAQAGHFGEVISAIDTMIGVLKEEGANDLKSRDKCRTQLHDIESKSQDLTWKMEVNDAEINKLDTTIEKLEALETKTIEEIKTVSQQITDLTSSRTQENGDFQAAKTDDEKAVQLLTEAKEALKKYYTENNIEMGPTESGRAAAAMLQSEPEAKFSSKGSRKNENKGIVALLENIIEDLNTEIANGVKAEEAAQLEDEAQKKAAEDLKAALEKKKTNLASDIALRKTDKTAEENKKTANENDLNDQTSSKELIDPNCKLIEEKFADREAKREAEIDGLRQAKEFLAGYQVSQ